MSIRAMDNSGADYGAVPARPLGKAGEALTRGGADTASPYVIREADCHREGGIGIHWLRGTCPVELVQAVRSLMQGWFGGATDLEHGRSFYRKLTTFEAPSVALLTDGIGDASQTVLLEVPGGVLEGMSAGDLLELIRSLRNLNFQCSRIDVEFDDFEKIISPLDVKGVVQAGNVAGFQKFQFHEQGDVGSSVVGSTVALGSRGGKGSGKFLRVYDKRAESEGAVDAIRWECEFSGVRAKVVFAGLAGCSDGVSMLSSAGAFLGGCVDFIEKGSKHLDRCDRLEWYQKIVDAIGRAVIRIVRKAPTVERMAKWVQTNVMPTLACIREAYRQDGWDEGELDRMILEWSDEGRERWLPRHMAALVEYLRPGRYGLSESI